MCLCVVFEGTTENAGVENAGVAKIQGWKSREWKMRHQTAGVENARVTSMESQNSRYLTLLQVGSARALRRCYFIGGGAPVGIYHVMVCDDYRSVLYGL